MAYPSKTDRRAILAAALKLLARDGLSGTSLRAVAGSLRLAPNALYRYFENHAHLQTAIAAEVAAKMHASILHASHKRDPQQSIRALAGAYMKFARDQHRLYEALVIPRPATGEDAVAPERLWLFVSEQVSRVSGPKKAPQATVALWAFLHGMAALQSAGVFDEEKPFSSFAFGLQAWMKAVGRKKGARGKKK